MAPGRAPLEVIFFAVVKSFEYKIAISANFVQTVKNSINCHVEINAGGQY